MTAERISINQMVGYGWFQDIPNERWCCKYIVFDIWKLRLQVAVPWAYEISWLLKWATPEVHTHPWMVTTNGVTLRTSVGVIVQELSQFDLHFFSELPTPPQPVLRVACSKVGREIQNETLVREIWRDLTEETKFFNVKGIQYVSECGKLCRFDESVFGMRSMAHWREEMCFFSDFPGIAVKHGWTKVC